jgi:biopolymer transport protein ExbD
LELSEERSLKMMLDFNCPFCGKALTADDKLGGKKAKCPGCQKVITIPKADTQSEEDVQEQRIKPG